MTLTYGCTPVWSPVETADVLVIGSVLQVCPQSYSGNILGAGLIADMERRMEKAKIWAVRGELTRQRIGAPQDTPLGDPGLLAWKLFDNTRLQYTLGIIPHYVDQQDPRIKMIKKKYRNDVLVIDVKRKSSSVVSDITRCERILSSSLHGLVVADSFGIPNGWILLSDKVIGKGFKFRDYFSGIKVKATTLKRPIILDGSERLSKLVKYALPPPLSVRETAEKLDEVFRTFVARWRLDKQTRTHCF